MALSIAGCAPFGLRPLDCNFRLYTFDNYRFTWYTPEPMASEKPIPNLRKAVLIGGAALLGAAWAAFNLYRAGGNGEAGAIPQLVWVVFATPFFTFWGWLAAERQAGWRAAFVCFCIYFFSIFAGARLELLIQGKDLAGATHHALYFRLTLVTQLVGCLVVAVLRGLSRGTMSISTKA